MSMPQGLLTPAQERELEKVNAFYLQKEAEVCLQPCGPLGSAAQEKGPQKHLFDTLSSL